MKKVFKILLVIALTVLCYETVAQNPGDTQPKNGQVFDPNRIAMIYVEGQGDINGFYIGRTEVTDRVWTAVMGRPRVKGVEDSSGPVIEVSWLEVQGFIKKLNELSGRTYRLPTVAEWVFAAKGGTLSQGYIYSGSNTIGEVARYSKNSKGNRWVVGTLKPNELGIYDMTGNVYEMCEDCWKGNCNKRAFKGGAYPYSAKWNRIDAKGWNVKLNTKRYDVGFRLVLQAEGTGVDATSAQQEPTGWSIYTPRPKVVVWTVEAIIPDEEWNY